MDQPQDELLAVHVVPNANPDTVADVSTSYY